LDLDRPTGLLVGFNRSAILVSRQGMWKSCERRTQSSPEGVLAYVSSYSCDNNTAHSFSINSKTCSKPLTSLPLPHSSLVLFVTSLLLGVARERFQWFGVAEGSAGVDLQFDEKSSLNVDSIASQVYNKTLRSACLRNLSSTKLDICKSSSFLDPLRQGSTTFLKLRATSLIAINAKSYQFDMHFWTKQFALIYLILMFLITIIKHN